MSSGRMPHKFRQAMLTAATLAAVVAAGMASGCSGFGGAEPGAAAMPPSPYRARQVFAVAPLRNESGSAYVDPAAMADKLTHELQRYAGIDTLPVNRVLAAMAVLRIDEIQTREQAMAVRQELGVDGLVTGTVTAYDPYDPPKLGLNVEVYLGPHTPAGHLDTRALTRAAVDGVTRPVGRGAPGGQPVSTVAGVFDAADPAVARGVMGFGSSQSRTPHDPESWRVYRISMDLYSQYVSRVMVARLMHAERARLGGHPRPSRQLATAPAS